MPHNLISVSKGSCCFCTCLLTVLLFTQIFSHYHILRKFCGGFISFRDENVLPDPWMRQTWSKGAHISPRHADHDTCLVAMAAFAFSRGSFNYIFVPAEPACDADINLCCGWRAG